MYTARTEGKPWNSRSSIVFAFAHGQGWAQDSQSQVGRLPVWLLPGSPFASLVIGVPSLGIRVGVFFGRAVPPASRAVAVGVAAASRTVVSAVVSAVVRALAWSVVGAVVSAVP